MPQTILNDENFNIIAAKFYYTPTGIDVEEFNTDVKRFSYIKRLINRYHSNGDLSPRLILNHLIVVNNVFGIEFCRKAFELKLDKCDWEVIKPFLLYLRYITEYDYPEIILDPNAVQELRMMA